MTSAMQKMVLRLLWDQARKLKRKMLEDQPDVGRWAGDYRIFPHKGSDHLHLFSNDSIDPLRFCHAESGFEFRPEDVFVTDFGSIPWIFRGFPRKWLRLMPADFREAYILHDSCCNYGRAFVRKAGADVWRPMSITFSQADVLLFWFLTAQSPSTRNEATRLECQAVYRAAKMFHAIKRK